MTSEIAAFRIPEPEATEVNDAIDQLQADLKAWIEAAKSEAQERWGRDAVLLEWREGREVYGIKDLPWDEQPKLHNMPTKEWKRLDVPEGWERLVDHGNKPDALRPRLKATKDWVKEWTKKAPPTAHQKIAKVLDIQSQCFYGLHLYSFGIAQFDDGVFLIWPESMVDHYIENEDKRDTLANYVPEYAERVPLSEYHAAKEAHEKANA